MNNCVSNCIGASNVAICAISLALFAWPAFAAQEKPARPAADVERMVRDGMLEALEARMGGGRTPDELQLLAQTAANKAARAKDDAQRQSAFADAEKRYEKWITAVSKAASDPDQRAALSASARLECANMILGRWVLPDLDELELYNGRKGDAKRALALLLKARKYYETAQQDIEPLGRKLDEQRGQVEDRYLELGIFDSIPRVRLDVRFNLAWTGYYLARYDSRNVEQRASSLAVSERLLRELLETGQTGEAAARCGLGLAIVLRELGKYSDATPLFVKAIEDAGAAPLAAQIRYEFARSQIASGRFEDARQTLAPLSAKNVDELSAEDRPARFYINLAVVWDAYSYLLEADHLNQQAATSAARDGLLKRAATARETGMARLNHLSSRGGPWPNLIGAYVASAVRSDADIRSLTPGELLFAGRQFYDEKKYGSALANLKEAMSRKDLSPELLGEILFETGLCHFQMKDNGAAADAFGRIAKTLKNHPKAPQAAVYTYQLRSMIAETSKQPKDYLEMAVALESFLASYPQHERRDEALWWLPAAYQAAGEHAKAIEHFAKVPVATVRWEEAQYRGVMCKWLLFESQRAAHNDAEQAAQASRIADELDSYSRAALSRAENSRDPKQTRKWAVAAQITAAELRSSALVGQYQAALNMLTSFEDRNPDSDAIGRVLAVRIAAYRGLKQYDAATRVVEQFLQTVPPGQAGGVLAAVARGMSDEIERLQGEGRNDDARRLARDAIPTFQQLEKWVGADTARAGQMDVVQFGLARISFLAGDSAAALPLVQGLVERDATNGAYRQLLAQILTSSLSDAATPAEISAARSAWEAMLRDSSLRTNRPDAYWEARYNLLTLLLREGRADEVARAIQQEEVWYPEMGGPQWRAKFLELRQKASP